MPATIHSTQSLWYERVTREQKKNHRSANRTSSFAFFQFTPLFYKVKKKCCFVWSTDIMEPLKCAYHWIKRTRWKKNAKPNSQSEKLKKGVPIIRCYNVHFNLHGFPFAQHFATLWFDIFNKQVSIDNKFQVGKKTACTAQCTYMKKKTMNWTPNHKPMLNRWKMLQMLTWCGRY